MILAILLSLSINGESFIKEHEGLKLYAYENNKIIYFGHKTKRGEKYNHTIEQAEQYFKSDVIWAEQILNKYVKVPLTQNQSDVLIDFIYNIGSGNFYGSSLLKAINSRDSPKVIKREFMKWKYAYGVKLVNPLLIKRRKDEIQMYFKN